MGANCTAVLVDHHGLMQSNLGARRSRTDNATVTEDRRALSSLNQAFLHTFLVAIFDKSCAFLLR